METVARKLIEVRKEYGGHAVVFNRPGPGGSPARDYGEWVVRLAYAFGSPNNLATGHVCQWHRDTGSKYTYGDENIPEADYENTALLLIWGHNPYTSVRCNVRDIRSARRKGAKLVVIHLLFNQEMNQPKDESTIRPWPNLEPKIGLLS